jgi:hypothetical protein
MIIRVLSDDPEVEVDEETLQILDERVADGSALISAAEARTRMSEWVAAAKLGR